MSLRYAYNTNGFVRNRLDDAIEMIAEAGYDGVSLTPDICHLDPYAVDVRLATARVARRLREAGLGCVIETGAWYVIDARAKHAPTLISADAGQRARRMDFLQRCMEIAAELQAECFTFWSGPRAADVSASDAEAWLLEGTGEVVRRCASYGLVPAMEPEPEMMTATVGHWSAISRAVPGTRLALDLGHCLVTQDILPQDAIRRHAGDIATIHLEDMKRGVHLHLPFGEGDMDLAAVLQALVDVRFAKLVCVELSADAHRAPAMVRQAMDWLRLHEPMQAAA